MKLKYIFLSRCCERGLKLTFFPAIFYQSMDYNFIMQSLLLAGYIVTTKSTCKCNVTNYVN